MFQLQPGNNTMPEANTVALWKDNGSLSPAGVSALRVPAGPHYGPGGSIKVDQ